MLAMIVSPVAKNEVANGAPHGLPIAVKSLQAEIDPLFRFGIKRWKCSPEFPGGFCFS
jgi:hypothetical protein